MLSLIVIFALYLSAILIQCQPRQLISITYPYEFPLEISNPLQALMRLCLGTPKQCLNFKIATNVDATFVVRSTPDRKGFNPSNSSSLKPINQEKTIKLSTSTITGFSQADTLQIPGTDIIIPDFLFVIVDNLYNASYSGVIGLGSVYFKNEYSIVQMLYNSHYITKKMFSIHYLMHHSNGNMVIGNIGSVTDKTYKSCSLNNLKTTKRYECRMEAVLYYNEYAIDDTTVYQMADNVVFSPGSSFFFCPKDFFDFMLAQVFKPQFARKECAVEADYFHNNHIICSKDILSKGFGKLIFVFGKWNVKLPIFNLFRKEEKGERFYFCIKYHQSISNWMLGFDFYQRYHVIFDLEEQKVHIKP